MNDSARNFRFLPQILGGGFDAKKQMARCGGHSCNRSVQTLVALPCTLDRLLYPVLRHSTSSSCCCAFSSNFCVAMTEQLCSNPWETVVFKAKFGIISSDDSFFLSFLGFEDPTNH